MVPNFHFFRLFFAFFLLFTAANLQAQIILDQNFDDLQQIEEFEGTPPNQGQVDTINLRPVNEEPVFSIGAGAEGRHLLIEKRGNATRHFSRTSGFDDAALLKVKFSLRGISGTNAGKVMALFIGKELGNTSFTPNRANRWAQLLFMRNGNGSWHIQNEVEGNVPNASTATFEEGELVEITIIVNNSGENVLYEAPNGGLFTIEQQRVDVWVGNVPVINNAEVYAGPNADLSEVKFLTWNTALSANLQLDNLLIEEMNFISLPVDLVYFSAKLEEGHAALSWQTGWESNSSHFEVERSFDGKNFTAIGERKAQGESTESHTYLFKDKDVIKYAAAKAFYRLRQVDTDGAFSYSKIAVVGLSQQPSVMVKAGPNPFSSKIRLQLNSSEVFPLRLRLLNSQGKSLMEQEIRSSPQADSGFIVLAIPKELQAGLYLMEVRNPEGQQLIRLLKE